VGAVLSTGRKLTLEDVKKFPLGQEEELRVNLTTPEALAGFIPS
jgi:hypothetical protein